MGPIFAESISVPFRHFVLELTKLKGVRIPRKIVQKKWKNCGTLPIQKTAHKPKLKPKIRMPKLKVNKDLKISDLRLASEE